MYVLLKMGLFHIFPMSWLVFRGVYSTCHYFLVISIHVPVIYQHITACNNLNNYVINVISSMWATISFDSDKWFLSLKMNPVLCRPEIDWSNIFGSCFFVGGDLTCTPWKINGWNLQITHLEGKMIFRTSMIICNMLIFRGVKKIYIL